MGSRLPSPRTAVDLVELPFPASPRVDGTTVRLHRRRGWIAGTGTVREIWRHLQQQTISTRPRRPRAGTRPGLTFREHIADPAAPLQEGVVPLFVGQGSVAEVVRDSGEGDKAGRWQVTMTAGGRYGGAVQLRVVSRAVLGSLAPWKSGDGVDGRAVVDALVLAAKVERNCWLSNS